MATCLYGSSASGTAPAVDWITYLDAEAYLGTQAAIYSLWLNLIIPRIIQPSTWCLVEPPQPVYPGDTVVALAVVDPAAFAQVVSWLNDCAIWWKFQHDCVCNANPGPCSSVMSDSQWNAMTLTAGTGGNYHWILEFHVTCTGQYIYGVETYLATGATVHVRLSDETAAVEVTNQILALPAGRHVTPFASPIALTNGHTYAIEVRQDATAMQIHYNNSTGTPATQTCFTFPQFVYGTLDNESDNATYPGWLGVAPDLCGASVTPPPPGPPPVTIIVPPPVLSCTGTTDICSLLNTILAVENTTFNKLKWLANRAEPYAYLTGTAHTGLSGAGTLAVQDALGVIVNVTTIPGGWGSNYETPRRRIPQLGMIAASDGTNEDYSRPIHYQHQVHLWHAPWATQLIYNFANGVSGSLTPIYPEP